MLQRPVIRHLATASFIAPLVATALVLTIRGIWPAPLRYFPMGLSMFVVAVLGLGAACVALYWSRKERTTGSGFRSVVGLMANAVLLAFMAPAFF